MVVPGAGEYIGGSYFYFNGPIISDPIPSRNQLNPRVPSTGQGNGAYGLNRNGNTKYHDGLDITSTTGEAVVAAGSGKVISVTPDPAGYGNQIIINHGNGIYSQSGHLSSVDVKVGQEVSAGETIGAVGRSGNLPPNAQTHLHYEIREGGSLNRRNGGNPVDPLNYLPGLYFQNGVLLNPGNVDNYLNNLGQSDDNRTTDQIGTDNMNAVLRSNELNPPNIYTGDTDANNASLGNSRGGE